MKRDTAWRPIFQDKAIRVFAKGGDNGQLRVVLACGLLSPTVCVMAPVGQPPSEWFEFFDGDESALLELHRSLTAYFDSRARARSQAGVVHDQLG